MAEKKITCIICPIGCEITVQGEGDRIDSITGHTCKRGEEYARSEFTHPTRILTSTAKVVGADVPLVPLRSSAPVPQELLFACMAEIQKLEIKAPVKRYDVLIPNILGTGIDIVATGNVG
jgi:CxxC motif-containing protein